MKKLSLVICLIMILGTVLSSCGGRSYKAFTVDPDYKPDENAKSTTSVQGFDGEKIEVKKNIEKIVCFSPEAAIIIRGLGGQRLITATDEETTNAIISNNVITEDQIAAQNPDVVFINDTYSADLGDIPCIRIPTPLTISDTKTLITITEKVMSSKKDSYADEIDKQINLAQSATAEYVSRFSVYIDLGEFKTSGTGTYVNEIINICGGENIFKDKDGYFTATKEEIIAANPTFIFTTENTSVYTRDQELRKLDCAMNGRILKIESAKIKYASQNIADVIPTIFNEINNYKNSVAN